MWPLKQLTGRVKVLHRQKKLLHMLAKPASMHSLRHADGGPYHPLPLSTNWFGMALNVADPPREHTSAVEVGRERV